MADGFGRPGTPVLQERGTDSKRLGIARPKYDELVTLAPVPYTGFGPFVKTEVPGSSQQFIFKSQDLLNIPLSTCKVPFFRCLGNPQTVWNYLRL